MTWRKRCAISCEVYASGHVIESWVYHTKIIEYIYLFHWGCVHEKKFLSRQYKHYWGTRKVLCLPAEIMKNVPKSITVLSVGFSLLVIMIVSYWRPTLPLHKLDLNYAGKKVFHRHQFKVLWNYNERIHHKFTYFGNIFTLSDFLTQCFMLYILKETPIYCSNTHNKINFLFLFSSLLK